VSKRGDVIEASAKKKETPRPERRTPYEPVKEDAQKIVDEYWEGEGKFIDKKGHLANGKARFEQAKKKLNSLGYNFKHSPGTAQLNRFLREYKRDNEDGGNGKPRRNDKPLTKGELKTFIDESLADRNGKNKNALIGKIEKEAKKRIEDAYGKTLDIENISTDSSSIVHAATKSAHNLKPEDLLLAVDVINTTTDIERSDKQHQNNDVLIFKKDIDGEITFLTEVHVKDGYLQVFDAWRQKKSRSRRRPDAAKRPPRADAQNASTPDGTSPVSPESPEKSSDFAKIQEKYQSAKAVEGDEDEIQVGKELIHGKWRLVEASTPTASHDETNFHKTPGFPADENGATINDRDYGHDREAQEIVMEIGADYDGQAVSVDNPVIVTKDGIVISGNNRTMSSKIAARKGTDQGYIEALKRKAKKFGFTPEQVEQFKHPRVIFETAENTGYSTDQFAKFNKSSKKAMSPIESAVKVSKTIKTVTVESIAGKMEDFETLGELYADRNAVNEIFNTLQRDAIISAMDRPQYVVDGGITGAGKEFLETVLIGSVINESNIRGLNREGCKSIRQKLVRAITPLIENKGMDGYSISKELNEAVDIAMQVAVQKDKFKSIDDYTSQKSLFGIEDDPVSVEIARRLEGTQKDFAAFMQSMNGGLKYAANGEADIFMGGVESREAILGRMLNLKKAIGNVIDFFRNLRAGKGARFIKKAVPVRGENGATELSQRWMQESIEGIAPYVEGAGISETGTKVVAVDFDGVINSYVSGWKGPSETDAPVLSAAESLKTLFNSGYKVIIFSTRANTREGIETIREYLRKHTENNELADTIEITGQKPIADMYIDDRAIPFNGDWEETLKQIEQFKPWTERDESISDETVNLPDGIYQGKRFAYNVRLDNVVLFSTKIGIRCTERHAAPCKVKIISGKPYRIMRKSLTWSGYPLEGRAKVQGMDISIENKKGSVRSGTDKDGHEWSIKMNFDYGYIRGTVGKDKDHVDCYIGPNPEAETVFIIHQNDPATGEYDEDKVMLGFDREEEARKAYLSQYDRPGFLGGIETMDIETFKDKAFDPESRGKKLRA
ncbi:MAG: hypothetical protein LBD29_03005, partial [Treponema sp.]|nr:hypothetical protein [Treponema sp.]